MIVLQLLQGSMSFSLSASPSKTLAPSGMAWSRLWPRPWAASWRTPVYGAGAEAQRGDLSEELKAAVLRYMDALLHAAYHDVVFKLFEPAMLPGLGAAISLLLALGEQEKSLTVQAAALKCLQALTLQCDCSLDHVSVGQ